MKLAVIIVNYNVQAELQACLQSVVAAMNQIDGEIFVVDNNSTDSSVELVRSQFPQVKLITNNQNLGFAKANNQAIQATESDYVLLLNPDTIVQPSSFSKMVQFMDSHPGAGGLGVKMLDEYGNFLPESKRGIPTPRVAFCKLFGVWRLFPKSDFFNHYYLGKLPENQTNAVEILAGACMLIRCSVLNQIGLLNEDYFLYGEDIDISYRILQAGYKNYYFPEVSITHLKARSTQKLPQQSIQAFYDSMVIFANQHFGTNKRSLYSFAIKTGIWIRRKIALLGK